MKLKTKELKSGLTTDTKTRRRTNVTQKRANITAAQIEEGITIEALTAINVPVYQYETQVTIHGILPDFTGDRVNGYKALTRNKNKSIGVRYIAIDAEKKSRIAATLKHLGKWSCQTSSTAFTLFKCFEQKPEMVESYKAVPRALIQGSIYGGQLMCGRYGLFVDVGSIKEVNMDALLKHLTELDKVEREDTIAVKEQEQRDKELKYQEEYEETKKARIEAKNNLLKRLKVALQPIKGEISELPKKGKFRVAVGFENDVLKWKQYESAQRGLVFCVKGEKTDIYSEPKFKKYKGHLKFALKEGRVFTSN
jgi:hypothetical protein